MSGLLFVFILMVLTGMVAPLVLGADRTSPGGLGKMALIIIDIQNDYFPGGRFTLYESEKASLKAKSLLEAFRRKQLTVIHVRHESLDPSAPFFLPNTSGEEIHPNVAPISGETVIVKHEVSSFANTNLAEILKSKGFDHLVICGMQTNVCVKGTVLEASLRLKYRVTVITDASAALSNEIHEKALRDMTGRATFTTADEFISQFGS